MDPVPFFELLPPLEIKHSTSTFRKYNSFITIFPTDNTFHPKQNIKLDFLLKILVVFPLPKNITNPYKSSLQILDISHHIPKRSNSRAPLRRGDPAEIGFVSLQGFRIQKFLQGTFGKDVPPRAQRGPHV